MDDAQRLRILAARGMFRDFLGMDVAVMRYVALGLADGLILGWTTDMIEQGKSLDYVDLYELIQAQLPGADLSDSDDALRSLADSIAATHDAKGA